MKGVAFFGQAYLMGTTSQRIIADLRGALFDHLLRLSPSFYARRHSGDLLSRVGNDVQAVEAAVSTAIASYLRDGLTVVVMLVNCFLIDWKLSLVTFVAIPITILPVVRIARRLKKVTVQSQSTLGKISELVQETPLRDPGGPGLRHGGAGSRPASGRRTSAGSATCGAASRCAPSPRRSWR